MLASSSLYLGVATLLVGLLALGLPIRAVSADEILLFRTLTWIRRLGRHGPESILEAPPHAPLLGVATRTGFAVLADEPGREIVFGFARRAGDASRTHGTPPPCSRHPTRREPSSSR